MPNIRPDRPKPRLDTTLVKGLTILETLAASEVPLGISALSDQLGLGKSNIHRLLATLIHLGFIRQEAATRRYSPTFLAWEIGSAVVERNALRRAARPVLHDLRAASGETTYLATLSGVDILYLDKVDGPYGIRSASRAGLRVPAVYTASGKMLLAMRPNHESVVDRAIAELGEAAQFDRASVLAELQKISREGFATSSSGWTQGVISVAVPIDNGRHPVSAAIGCAVPASHWKKRRLASLVSQMRAGAARIADTLELER